MRLVVNLFCRDVDAQFTFYRGVLALPEIEASRSPIFRALGDGTAELGLNAQAAYTLLGLADRAAGTDAAPPVTAYPTFQLDTPAAVDEAFARARDLGARVRREPFATYYGQWQAVLEDPEGNVFRLAATTLPDGVAAARPPWLA
jgi:catechol 2,3-dioxygenase-like lactoylglutathione lyase family enzyme